MSTLPNVLSFSRLPLAVLFWQGTIALRAWSIILALLTDWLDGFLARRYKWTSWWGSLLDPLMDKLFVLSAVGVLLREEVLSPMETASLLCREFSLVGYGFMLAWKGQLWSYRFRAIWMGKVTTVLQLFALFLLTLHIPVPSTLYALLTLLGLLAFVELCYRDRAESAG